MAYPRSVKKKKLENEGIIRLNASVPKPVAIHEVAAARAPVPVPIREVAQGAKPQKVPKPVAAQGGKVPASVHTREVVQGARVPLKVPKPITASAVKTPKLPMPHMPLQQRPDGVELWQILPAFLATVSETVATYNSGAKGKKNLSGAAIGGVGQIIDTAKSAMAQKHPEYIPYLAAIKVNPDYESAKNQIKELKFDFDFGKSVEKYLEKHKNNIIGAIAVAPNRRESMSPAGIERVLDYLVNLERSKGKFRTEEDARKYLSLKREEINNANDKAKQQYALERDKILALNAATILLPDNRLQGSRGDLEKWFLARKNNKNLWTWLNQQPEATDLNKQPSNEEIEKWKEKLRPLGGEWSKELQNSINNYYQMIPPQGSEGIELQSVERGPLLGNNLVPIPPAEVPKERLKDVPAEMNAENWQRVDDPRYGPEAAKRVVVAAAMRNAIDEVISNLPKALGPMFIDTELLRKSAPDIARSLSAKMGITGEDWQRYDEMTRYAHNPNLVNAPVVAPQIPQLGTIKPLPISGGNPNAAPEGDEDMYVEPLADKDPYRIGKQNQHQIQIKLDKFAAPPNAQLSANDVMVYNDPLPHLYTPMTYAPLPIGIDALAPRENVPIRNISATELKNQTFKIKKATENLQRINADLADTEKKLVIAKTEKGKLTNEHTLVNMAVQLLTGVYKDDPEAVERYYKLPKDVSLNTANDYIKHLANESERISEDIANLEKRRQEQRNSALEAQKALYDAQMTLRMMQTGNAAKKEDADLLQNTLFNAQQQLQKAIDTANKANDTVESAKNRYNEAEQILYNMSQALNNQISQRRGEKENQTTYLYLPYFKNIQADINEIARTATLDTYGNIIPDDSTKKHCQNITGIKQFGKVKDPVISYSITDTEHTMYKDAGAIIKLQNKKYNSANEENTIKEYLNHLDLNGEKIYNLPLNIQRARLVKYYENDIDELVSRIKHVYKGMKDVINPIMDRYKRIVSEANTAINAYEDWTNTPNNKKLKKLASKLDQVNMMYERFKNQSHEIKNKVGKTIEEQIDIITKFQNLRDSPEGSIAKAQNDFLDAEAGHPQNVQPVQSSANHLRLLVPQQMLASQPQLQPPQQPKLQYLQSSNPEMAAALEVIEHPRIPPWIKDTLAWMVGLGVIGTAAVAIAKNYKELSKFRNNVANWFEEKGKKEIGENYNIIKERVDNFIGNAEKNINGDDIQKRMLDKINIDPLIENANSVIDINDFARKIDENAKKYGISNLSMSNISSLLGQEQDQDQKQQAPGFWGQIGNYAKSGLDKLNSTLFPPPQQRPDSNYLPVGAHEPLLLNQPPDDQRNSLRSHFESIRSSIGSRFNSFWNSSSSQQQQPQMFAREGDNKNFDDEDEKEVNKSGKFEPFLTRSKKN